VSRAREGFVAVQNEELWLRYRVIRMRTALRFAISPEVANILRELIADGEERLLALEGHADEPATITPLKLAPLPGRASAPLPALRLSRDTRTP
jgi:hypothetical protein